MAIPDDVLLAVWGPFGAACVLCLCVSWVYLWRLSLRREREPFALACGAISVAASLAAAALVPADVSLVSAMKGDDGTFQPWAANESSRKALQSEVQLAYFVLYGLLVLLAFVVLPFAYFFSEEKDDTVDRSACSRAMSALKYTVLFLLVAGVLLTIGAVIPLRQAPPSNSTEWDKIRFLVDELAASRGEDSLRFLLSLFVLVGMFLLIVYTGFGMSALPLRLVLGERSAAREVADVGERRRALRTQLDSLARHGGGSNRQRSARLEEQLHSLDERQRRLEEFRDSCSYRLRFLIRPLQIVLGVVFALLGLLLWTSLLLSNVDKAMHSLGFHMGYLLDHPELPNPLDMTLVWLQRWGRLHSGLGTHTGPVTAAHRLLHVRLAAHRHLVPLSSDVPPADGSGTATGSCASLHGTGLRGAGSQCSAALGLPSVFNLRVSTLPGCQWYTALRCTGTSR
ncbi:hypothetical protein MTO96_003865 [Rhipicephalus appendiculatus]